MPTNNLPNKTYVFGVDDCKIFPVTMDTSGQFTCGAGIDIPGIKQISLTPNVELKTLTGDEKTIAAKVKQPDIAVTLEFAELSLSVLAALTGGTVTVETGKTTFRVEEGDDPPYFQLQAQIKGVDYAGDMHIVIYKAKYSGAPINGTEDDFTTFSLDCTGAYTDCKWGSSNKGRLWEIIENVTATDLSAITHSA